MDLLIISIVIIIGCFSFVVIFGAPYLPTMNTQRQQAILMLNLKSGQTLVELGCGDGAVLILAGQKGIKCIGYELNPILILIAKFRTRRYRKLVTVKWRNFWAVDISSADAVYIFLIARLMPKLEKKILNEGKPGLKILSYTFQFPSMACIKSSKGLFLYQLPTARQKAPKKLT